MRTLFEGKCHRVIVESHPAANAANGRYLISVETEDDGNWHRGLTFASHWLPELRRMLELIPPEAPSDETKPAPFSWNERTKAPRLGELWTIAYHPNGEVHLKFQNGIVGLAPGDLYKCI